MAPHYYGNASYVQADVFATGFVELLRAKLEAVGGFPTIMCGMHLCGALSPEAVDIMAQLPTVVGLVLSPCCLPSKKLSDVAWHSGSNPS